MNPEQALHDDLALLAPSRALTPPERAPWDREPGARFNIASYLPARAAERPFQRALVLPQGRDGLGRRAYSHVSFAQLDALCDAYAHGLTRHGLRQGDRVIMLVRPGVELIALTYALFKIGAAPVMIDPGMGRKAFLQCVSDATPDAMIGIPLAHMIRSVFPKPFASVRAAFTTKKRLSPGALPLPLIADFNAGPFPLADTTADDLAAVLFTSGSTGPAKGVLYTHGIFDGQVRAIKKMYGLEPGEIEVPAFPLFSLFSIAIGMTCVIPDIDATQFAKADPRAIVEAILDHGATSAFGSPSIWNRVGPWCLERDITLPSLRRILTAGAPVPTTLHRAFARILTDGAELHTPYGATECLPVASIGSADVISETGARADRGHGICVGVPVPNAMVRVIAITDGPIATWADAQKLPAGEVGELCVSAPQATRAYDRRPDANARAKIADPDRGEGAFWHRMGDVGYLDDLGRFWYCGRKSHRVQAPGVTLYSIQCESIFNTDARVRRCALVGVGAPGQQKPVLVVEPSEGFWPRDAREREVMAGDLLAIASEKPLTAPIHEVLFHHDLPVDRRHNSKIHREELAEWATRSLEKGRRATAGPARRDSIGDVLSPRRAAEGDRVAQVALVAVGALALGALVGLTRRNRRRLRG